MDNATTSDWSKLTGNMDDMDSATADEINNDWNKIATQSRERWSRENPYKTKKGLLRYLCWKLKTKWLDWGF